MIITLAKVSESTMGMAQGLTAQLFGYFNSSSFGQTGLLVQTNLLYLFFFVPGLTL